MAENLFETQYDLTKKSKLKKFYDSYKIIILSSLFILIILCGAFIYYTDSKENKQISLSEVVKSTLKYDGSDIVIVVSLEHPKLSVTNVAFIFNNKFPALGRFSSYNIN